MATREEVFDGAEVKSVVVLDEMDEPYGGVDEGFEAADSEEAEDPYRDHEFSDLEIGQDGILLAGNRNMRDDDPYRNPKTKIVHVVGKTEITYGQARLYGLLDNEGNIKLDKLDSSSTVNNDVQRKHIELLSKPYVKLLPSESPSPFEEPPTFQPKKSDVAMRAMKNPRCGYDFVNRLNERGDCLDSLTASNINSSGLKDIDAEKEMYAYKQDKLSCPKCKRTQSFDEYNEKRRFCSLCKEKYVQLNICDVFAFDNKLKEKLKKKEEKFAKIDEEMYGYEKKPFKAKPFHRPRSAPSVALALNATASVAATKTLSSVAPYSESAAVVTANVPPPRLTRKASSSLSVGAQAREAAPRMAPTPLPLVPPPYTVAAGTTNNSKKGVDINRVNGVSKGDKTVPAARREEPPVTIKPRSTDMKLKKGKSGNKFDALLEFS